MQQGWRIQAEEGARLEDTGESTKQGGGRHEGQGGKTKVEKFDPEQVTMLEI
jgi:hypothetical protein